MKPSFPRGLYVITDRDLCVESGMTASVRAALRGGSAIVQYRDKTGDHRRRQREAAALARECRNANALFIVNDDPELARACDAGGVHLGGEDTDLAQARQIIGDKRLIGVSCYDSIERARDAVAGGCDYVAFGSAFPSPTKPGAVHAPLRLFTEAARELQVPVVAIGGLTPANGGRLVAAGCHALAVISGVFGQPDPEAAARQYVRLFEQPPAEDGLE